MTSFENIISGSKPVLAEFWAPWCTYCRRIGPVMDKISRERQDIEVMQINIDEEPELAQEHRIEVIPTLLLFKNGKSGEALVAPASKAQIDAFIASEM